MKLCTERDCQIAVYVYHYYHYLYPNQTVSHMCVLYPSMCLFSQAGKKEARGRQEHLDTMVSRHRNKTPRFKIISSFTIGVYTYDFTLSLSHSAA